METNIVFLDIDGVLNTDNNIRKRLSENRGTHDYYYDYSEFDPICLQHLKEIVESVDAKIVVSSTWRYYAPDGRDWIKMLQNLGKVGVSDRVIDTTPVLGRYHHVFRGDEIQKWLDDAKAKGMNIGNFVILDDESDMKHLKKYLAQSTWEDGITEEVKEKAISILKGGVV